ncbi:MAG: HAD family hydrolase [Prevotella sp.]|nr:HAD family hydrolase [Prevotella sp.]
MNKRLIIFDFDGTLADTNALITKTMMMTIDEVGLEKRTREQCASCIGLPLAECFKALFSISDEVCDLCAATYRRLFEQNNVPGMVSLFPHVAETIRQLHDKGCVLTIATSRSHQSVVQFLQEFRLDRYVTYVLGADDVERAKPDPFPVTKTMSELGYQPEETLVVGDMKFDILMGQRAGAQTVGVTYGNGTLADLQECRADDVIDDFADLLRIVV